MKLHCGCGQNRNQQSYIIIFKCINIHWAEFIYESYHLTRKQYLKSKDYMGFFFIIIMLQVPLNNSHSYFLLNSHRTHARTEEVNPFGIVANVQNCNIIASEFELQSRYYVHFQISVLGKYISPLIPLAMG